MKKSKLKRKTPIKRQSKAQRIELGRRRLLKWELYQEQNCLCAECQRFMDYAAPMMADNYPQLSHEKPLGRGGVTRRKDCAVLCGECHSNKRHGQRNIYNSQPDWSRE